MSNDIIIDGVVQCALHLKVSNYGDMYTQSPECLTGKGFISIKSSLLRSCTILI
jgi:hypothetical protein